MSVDPVLAQVVADVLRDPAATAPAPVPQVGPGAAPAAGPAGAAPPAGLPPLWRTVRELEWPSVGVPEPDGGAGGSLADLATIVRLLAGHPVAVPLVEAAVAGWAAATAGCSALAGADLPVPVLPAPGDPLECDGDRLRGRVSRVPWASAADRLLVVVAGRLAVVDPAGAGVAITGGADLAGEPRDTVRLDAAPVLGTAPAPAGLVDRAALLRAAGLVGALERVAELTVSHVHTRRQFGRPLVAFQAVAHAVAEVACERAQAQAALAAALAAPTDRSRLAAARVVAGRAATTLSRLAHQLHGAIGITREHDLHRFTGRLLGWRDDLGSQREWSRWLGETVGGGGSAGLWRWLTGADGDDNDGADGGDRDGAPDGEPDHR